jgi:hypothetical protein
MLELADKNNQAKIAQQKYKPAGPNGRPKNKKDTTKRKNKRVLPKTKGYTNAMLWAIAAQKQISEIVTPAILGSINKKNLRELTNTEFEQLEQIKLNTLCNVEPFDKITAEKVYSIISGECLGNIDVQTNIQELVLDFTEIHSRHPNVEEMKQIQASAYAVEVTENELDMEEFDGDSSDNG